MNFPDQQLPEQQYREHPFRHPDFREPDSSEPDFRGPDSREANFRDSDFRERQGTARPLALDAVGSLQSLLGTVVIAVFVITFIVQAFQIPSPSMENTLLVGDYLLVNKLCYGSGGIGDYVMPYRRGRRGDIVVFHYPVTPAQHFVKRVIGVPGDRVRLVNKHG